MESQAIISGGKELFPAVAAFYAPVFRTDPLITYMLCSMPTQSARDAYLPAYFGTLLKAAALNKATFDTIRAGSGAVLSASVLIPPGRKVDNVWTLIPAGLFGCLAKLGIGGCRRMLVEYTPLSERAKRKAGLKAKARYYYVFFAGTDERARGAGLASRLMRRYQHVAAREGVPVWLEATTAASKVLYERLGWEVVDELVLGKGKVGSDGLEAGKGGQGSREGVKVWGMIWRPESKDKEFLT